MADAMMSARSARSQRSTPKAKQTVEQRAASLRPQNGRLDVSCWGLRTLDCLQPSVKVESLYCRVNQLTDVGELDIFPNLKVLDASSNLLTNAVRLPAGALRMLFLASNQISDIAVVPTIPTLEILSLSNNHIHTLENMNPQPELKVLSLSSNDIVSLKGLTVLPKIESVRFSENPIATNSYYMNSVAAACGPTLARIDGESFQRLDSLSVRVGVAVREGMKLVDLDTADSNASEYLGDLARRAIAPATLSSVALTGRAVEGNTLTAPACYMEGHLLETHYQWLRVGNGTEFILVENATAETYAATLDDVGYAVVCAVMPTLPDGSTGGTAYIVSEDCSAAPPCLSSLELVGNPIEGEMLAIEAEYVGGVEGDSSVKWWAKSSRGGDVKLLAQNTGTLELTLDTVGCSIVVEYLPVRDDGVAGEAARAETAVVLAARPSVASVAVSGQVAEGHTIEGQGRYFGGKEGGSVFQWYRGDSSSGPFVPIPGANSRGYAVTLADVDHVLKFEYTPVSTRGVVGDAVCALTEVVAAGKPQARKVQIIGKLEELSEIRVKAEYFGGVEGASEITWSRKSEHDENDEWVLIPGARGPVYTLSSDDIDCYLCATYRPVRLDGAIGAAVQAYTAQTIGACVPRAENLTLSGGNVEGAVLRASVSYRGGKQGRVEAYYERVHPSSGTAVQVAQGFEYRLGVDDIGYVMRFRFVPIRWDGQRGREVNAQTDVVVCAPPQLVELAIRGDPVEGNVLRVHKQYFGGVEGASRFRWLRVRPADNLKEEVEHGDLLEYELTAADVDYVLTLEYLPVRSDGERGAVCTARTSKPIIPLPPLCENVRVIGAGQEGVPISAAYDYLGGVEGQSIVTWRRVPAETPGVQGIELSTGRTYTPVTDDIGSVLAVTVIPVRSDGASGAPVSALAAGMVCAAGPTVISLRISGEAKEGVTLTGLGKYLGGEPGTQGFQWVRESTGDVVGRDKTYTCSKDDISSRLLFEWTPVRSDGLAGTPQTISTAAVIPADPVCKSLSIDGMDGSYDLHYDYYGGVEGNHVVQWRRVFPDNTTTQIPGIRGSTYRAQPSDVGLCLEVAFTPVRDDGVAGPTVTARTTSPMEFRNINIVDKMQVEGRFVEGETIRCTYRLTPAFKGQVLLQWWRRATPKDNYVAIDGATEVEYRLALEDVGCVLRAQATPVLQGEKGQPISASTNAIGAAPPQLLESVIKVRGGGAFNSMFTLSGRYFGGKPGKPIIRWLRAPTRESQYREIPEATAASYQGSADDLGCYLLAEYTPVRDDGVKGPTVGKEIGPLEMDSLIQGAVDERLNLETPFQVQLISENGAVLSQPESRIVLVNKLKLKVRLTTPLRTVFKEAYNPSTAVFLHPAQPLQFAVQFGAGHLMEFLTDTPQTRDVIALLIRQNVRRAAQLKTFQSASRRRSTAASVQSQISAVDAFRKQCSWMQEGTLTNIVPNRPLVLKPSAGSRSNVTRESGIGEL